MRETPRYVVHFCQFKKNCMEVMNGFNTAWGGANVEYGYSVKTNRDPELIMYANQYLGWKVEVVSPDEYNYVKSLKINDGDIILNGPCKIQLFQQLSVLPRIVNLDNYDEVDEFVRCFPKYKGLVGLRVNFNLESKCPGETTAGEEVSRFGIDADSLEFIECINLLVKSQIINIGLHLHTSTKTRSLNVFSEIAYKAVELKNKTNYEFSFIDIGGGFFGGQIVQDKPTMEQYAITICDILKEGFNPNSTKLVLEPGASVLATCVTYQTKIVNKRSIRGVNILTVDGSLLHINPFMTKRTQPFEILEPNLADRPKINKQIVGGATCMENDRLANLIDYTELREGDVLSFEFAGAYTMGFNSHFILNPPHIDYIKCTDYDYDNYYGEIAK